ncbi:tetratricopeptide repeat protein [Deinococcus sp. VB343]|uniref:Tetratricopeptide repeat protein n=1 Tax=Deinococcus sp. VB142 TaxID=3112952 RepID=A0AAU6Q6Q3_9DEIO
MLGWQSRGLLSEGARRLKQLIDRAEATNYPKDATYRWACQNYCHLSLYSGGWTPEVAERLDETAQLSEQAGDAACLAQCRSVEGVFLAVTGQLERAGKVFKEVLQIAREGRAHYEQGTAFRNLASVHNNLPNSQKPLAEYLSQGMEHAEQHHLETVKGSLLLLNAEQLLGQRRFAEARTYLDQAEEIFNKYGLVKDLAFVHRIRGLVAYVGTTPGSAGSNEQLDLAAANWEMGSRMMAGNVVNRTMDLLLPQMGDIYLAKGELDAAEAFFRTGIQRAEQEQIKPLIINGNLGLGRTLFALGEYEQALLNLSTAFRMTEMPTVWCLVLEVAAATLGRLGLDVNAVRLWGKAEADRDNLKVTRYPVYAEYIEPEITKVHARVGEAEFRKIFEEGKTITRNEVQELMTMPQNEVVGHVLKSS